MGYAALDKAMILGGLMLPDAVPLIALIDRMWKKDASHNKKEGKPSKPWMHETTTPRALFSVEDFPGANAERIRSDDRAANLRDAPPVAEDWTALFASPPTSPQLASVPAEWPCFQKWSCMDFWGRELGHRQIPVR